MKKLLILTLAIICFSGLQAQTYAPATLMTITVAGDTAIINAGTAARKSKQTIARNFVSVQAVITKNSGTVAGTVRLQGSIDGTNYETIKITGLQLRDTANVTTLTNVAVQTVVWTVTGRYLFYRILGTGSGTMNARLTGYILPFKLY